MKGLEAGSRRSPIVATRAANTVFRTMNQVVPRGVACRQGFNNLSSGESPTRKRMSRQARSALRSGPLATSGSHRSTVCTFAWRSAARFSSVSRSFRWEATTPRRSTRGCSCRSADRSTWDRRRGAGGRRQHLRDGTSTSRSPAHALIRQRFALTCPGRPVRTSWPAQPHREPRQACLSHPTRYSCASSGESTASRPTRIPP